MGINQKSPIKVLYINHYGVFGGAQRSILETISAFPENSVHPHFLSPSGTVVESFKGLGISYTIVPGGLSKFDHTKLSYYKGLRWLILFRELAYVIPTVISLLKIKKKNEAFDIIHVNEITCILPLILAKKILKKPIVLHVRAIFNNDPRSKRTKAISRIISKYADAIIAIDETVAYSVPVIKKKTVIHNGFSTEGKLAVGSDVFSARLSGIPRRRLNIGYIGAIDFNKGIFDLLVAIKMCKENGMDVGLIVAGNGNSSKFGLSNLILNINVFNKDLNRQLFDFIRENELTDYIHPIGFSTNTFGFFEYIDAICFPTYYYAIGRPVFEAAFFNKPSIVTIKKSFGDAFRDGETGLKIEARNPTSIFEAIKTFYHSPDTMNAMGKNAYHLACKNFDIKKNALEILGIYKSLVINTSFPDEKC